MFKGHNTLNKELILSVVDEETLFRHYCPNFQELDTFFSAEDALRPYGKPDTKPSCKISRLSKGIYYKDFGTSGLALDIWNYIQRKYGLTYRQALEKVAIDFGIIDQIPDYKYSTRHSAVTAVTPPVKKKREISIRKRNWNYNDASYWYNQYFINRKLLEEYNIYPISHFWIDQYLFNAEALAYCYTYYHNEGLLLRKIYQPKSEDYKWISNIDSTVVQGIANIPKTADHLFITSSMKDIITLRLAGFNAVAPNNEATWLPEAVWEKFKTRYTHMYILFNSDLAGIENAQRFSFQYNIPYIFIPRSLFSHINHKDPSDLVKQQGSIEFLHETVNTQLLMSQHELPFVVQYKRMINNRIHTRTANVYARDGEEAKQKWSNTMSDLGISIFDLTIVNKADQVNQIKT